MIRGQGNAHRQRLLVQLVQDGLQLLLQPGMQHGIGSRHHALRSHLSGRGAKQDQQFGGSPAHILMRLHGRLPLQMPVGAWLGNSLVGAGFILTPLRQSRRFRLLVGGFNQLFFSCALGSWTVTVPAWRTRRAVPVGHHVRVLPKR
jgi:hypothetical protein